MHIQTQLQKVNMDSKQIDDIASKIAQFSFDFEHDPNLSEASSSSKALKGGMLPIEDEKPIVVDEPQKVAPIHMISLWEGGCHEVVFGFM